MNTSKLDNLTKVLAEHIVEINELIPDELKCLKCRKVLIDAVHGPCGCRCCRVCINEYLEIGCQICPGNTDECTETVLSLFQTDFSANRKISKLVVKCPSKMCPFESELINMPEHLRICPNKSLKCVFYDLGCNNVNVPAANMNEHLQLEGHKHMRMLMEIIDIMRNEMERLKENDMKNRNEIELLKQDSAIKEDRIESLEGEINLIKAEMSHRIERVECAETELDCTIDGINANIESINEEIKSIKEEDISNLEKEIGKSVDQLQTELNQMQQDWIAAIDINQTGLDKRMNTFEKWMEKQIDGTFVWAIDKIAERRKNDETVMSKYFYGMMEPYKMGLGMRVNGYRNVAGTGLRIYLYVYDDVRCEWLKWPLEACITMKIVNRATPDSCQMITKYCQIKRPKTDHYEYSEYFDFLYSDLGKESLLEGDSLVVECCVNII